MYNNCFHVSYFPQILSCLSVTLFLAVQTIADTCPLPKVGKRVKSGHHSSLTVMIGRLIDILTVDSGTTIIAVTLMGKLEHGATQQMTQNAGTTAISVNNRSPASVCTSSVSFDMVNLVCHLAYT